MIRRVTRDGHEFYIRPMRLTDADRLFSFMVGLSPESRRLFRPHAFCRDDALRAARDAQSGRSTRLVVVEPQGETLAAYAYFSETGVSDPRVPILGIAVADRFQNLGLGRLLMGVLIEEARSQGKSGLQLTVYKENARAIHLYESIGFRIFGDADGAKQHAMRLDFTPNETVVDRRGILLNPVPWNLAPLTADTWSFAEWSAYLDLLHASGANLAMTFIWPGHLFHPDEPSTLKNGWRYGVIRQTLEYARGLGMKTLVGLPFTAVPPSVWHRQPHLRASEVGFQGLAFCWGQGREQIKRYTGFLLAALADCADGFVLWVSGPAYCACPNCRDYARVVRDAVEHYQAMLAGRSALHLNLAAPEELEARIGTAQWQAVTAAAPQGNLALVSPNDLSTRDSLAERGNPFLLYAAHLESDSGNDAEALFPRPRLRQVDRLVAQNSGAAGVLGQRIMPHTQFVTDYVLNQKLLFPARAAHEILRDLGRHFYARSSHTFSFARSVWALDSWWETARRGDLADARDGLAALPSDLEGWVRTLQDTVQILDDLVSFLDGGEHHFDALVSRVHARMVESPAFQGYTVDRVWQARARTAITESVAGWLDMLREHSNRVP